MALFEDVDLTLLFKPVMEVDTVTCQIVCCCCGCCFEFRCPSRPQAVLDNITD